MDMKNKQSDTLLVQAETYEGPCKPRFVQRR